jgi:hypothetical protein
MNIERNMFEISENTIYVVIDSKDPAYRLAVNKLFHNKFDLEERECYTTIPTKFGIFKIIAYSEQFLDTMDECVAKREILENASYIIISESVFTHPEDKPHEYHKLWLTDILNVSYEELRTLYLMPIILKYIEKNISFPKSLF